MISPDQQTQSPSLRNYVDIGFDTQAHKPIQDNPYQNSSYQSLLQFQSQFEGVDANMMSAGTITQPGQLGTGVTLDGSGGGGISVGADASALIGGLSGSQAIQVDGSKGTIKLIDSTSKGYILFDGPNGRIVVNDGTTNRVVIGNLVP